jgi:hypothetical protein
MTADTTDRTHPTLILAVLSLGGIAYAMLSSAVIPALPTLEHALHTNETGVTWLLTAYLLSASVGTAILGRLGDMYGKERLLLITLVILTGGTLVSALTSSLALQIGARFIQGAAGGIFPLAFGIVRDEFPREKVAGSIGLLSAILGVGGGIGIVLSGVIVEHLNYHWLFWLGDRRGRDLAFHPGVARTRARQGQLGRRGPDDDRHLDRPAGRLRDDHLGLGLLQDARPDPHRTDRHGRLDLRRDAQQEPPR